MGVIKTVARGVGGAAAAAILAPEAIGLGVAAAAGAVIANVAGAISDDSIADEHYDKGYGDGHKQGVRDGNVATAKKFSKMMAEK
ncbi:hypothetical protein [Selenomonas sp. AB3002]|uniref:hypothetical protein n=1 Tax=Selenomonas sp. AB3002 TaxID=1392502 RepID=UPI000496681E